MIIIEPMGMPTIVHMNTHRVRVDVRRSCTFSRFSPESMLRNKEITTDCQDKKRLYAVDARHGVLLMGANYLIHCLVLAIRFTPLSTKAGTYL